MALGRGPVAGEAANVYSLSTDWVLRDPCPASSCTKPSPQPCRHSRECVCRSKKQTPRGETSCCFFYLAPNQTGRWTVTRLGQEDARTLVCRVGETIQSGDVCRVPGTALKQKRQQGGPRGVSAVCDVGPLALGDPDFSDRKEAMWVEGGGTGRCPSPSAGQEGPDWVGRWGPWLGKADRGHEGSWGSVCAAC